MKSRHCCLAIDARMRDSRTHVGKGNARIRLTKLLIKVFFQGTVLVEKADPPWGKKATRNLGRHVEIDEQSRQIQFWGLGKAPETENTGNM